MKYSSLVVRGSMRTRSRIICLSSLLVFILLVGTLYLSSLNKSTTWITRQSNSLQSTRIGEWMPTALPHHSKQGSNTGLEQLPGTTFDLKSGRHVLVYIHIQKTGGSHFIKSIVTAKTTGGEPLCYKPTQDIKKRLKKKRDISFCPISTPTQSEPPHDHVPEMWIVSEKTYGWVCGLHAFYTEMKTCVGRYLKHVYGPRERQFYYTTIIRHPVVRYVSEFLHVQRGATWMYTHICGRNVKLGEKIKQPCYDGYYEGAMWKNVTLEKFMACSDNWASNRQTLMLADLEDVDCLSNKRMSKKETEKRLLESAKRNLESFEFFGISEYMVESGKLFSDHFSVKLSNPPQQKKVLHLHTGPLLYKIWKDTGLYNEIQRINRLDMQLYHFALDLFEQRLKKMNITINRTKLDMDIYSLQDIISRAY